MAPGRFVDSSFVFVVRLPKVQKTLSDGEAVTLNVLGLVHLERFCDSALWLRKESREKRRL